MQCDLFSIICYIRSVKMFKNKNLNFYFRNRGGTSLAVQWLSLCTSNAGSVGLIIGQGTKIPHARGQKKVFRDRGAN